MRLRSSWIVAVALGVSIAPGCSGLFTKRAIERFSTSLQEQDLDKLKFHSSDQFAQVALRQEDSVKGLKMLKLPMGKVEIVSVEDLGDGKRKAHVKIGEKEKAKEIEYLLTKDAKGRTWVVDDIIMLQDSGNGQIVERSVSEQMDLLLTCREMLISWRGEVTEEKLDFCDDDLKGRLAVLPTPWLNQMFKELAGPGTQSTFKPDARLKGSAAFVVLPHPQGNLYLELQRHEDRWKLNDLAVEPKSKDSTGIRSLAKMVAALDQSSKFLSAYQGEDRIGLEQYASKHLYNKCLTGADFKEVPLPVATLLEGAYEARQFTDGTDSIKRVELLLQDTKETYMLTLREEDVIKGEGGQKVTEFRIDEVTIFEKGSKDVKRMSSLYLSHAIVDAYVAALQKRDTSRLREISSSDFNDRVWNRQEAVHFGIIPDPQLSAGEPSIISTVFRGDVSEVTLILGETPMTLVLNLANGWMVVDDVLMPAFDRPTSLKTNLEALLTVHAFAAALQRNDMNGLMRQSADGLDRIVWRQMTAVPDVAKQFVRPVLSEVVAIQPGEEWTAVRTSDGKVQADIKLVREGDSFVVHDVSLQSLSNSGQQMALLQTLRHMIAAGELGYANKRTGQIVPASGVASKKPQTVQHAVFEPIETSIYAEQSQSQQQSE